MATDFGFSVLPFVCYNDNITRHRWCAYSYACCTEKMLCDNVLYWN